MMTLVMALYAEGRSDERFLPTVIQRTTQNLLDQKGSDNIYALEPFVLDDSTLKQRPTQSERILEAARTTNGYHMLIIHADADAPTAERALRERVQPGVEQVQQAFEAQEAVCANIVPIIPVRMTEAWMLADPQALQAVIDTNTDIADFQLPERVHQVESLTHPKQTLQQVVHRVMAGRRRRRKFEMATVYEPLARHIRLERLQGIPAYQQFVQHLQYTLIALHMLPK